MLPASSASSAKNGVSACRKGKLSCRSPVQTVEAWLPQKICEQLRQRQSRDLQNTAHPTSALHERRTPCDRFFIVCNGRFAVADPCAAAETGRVQLGVLRQRAAGEPVQRLQQIPPDRKTGADHAGRQAHGLSGAVQKMVGAAEVDLIAGADPACVRFLARMRLLTIAVRSSARFISDKNAGSASLSASNTQKAS